MMIGGSQLGAGALLLVCLAAASTASVAQTPPSATATTPGPDTIDARTRKAVAEAFADALADDYANADLHRNMAQLIRDKLAAGAFDRIVSGADFAFALGDSARSVSHDKHLQVNFSVPPAVAPPRAAMPDLSPQSGEIPELRILPGNIGYMEVNGVPPLPFSRDAIAAAFAFLHNTDALIIDGRGNGGGDPHTVAFIMSYLSEGAPHVVLTLVPRKGSRTATETTDLGPLSYGVKKPVYYLTSHRTFSGGEELGYDIQTFGRGSVVGEITGGGGNLAGPVPLGHGFVAIVPNAIGVNPVSGRSWEGAGVKPDVEVKAGQALIEAQRLAIERLRSNATDPVSRAALDNRLRALHEQAEAAHGGSAPAALSAQQLAGVYASQDGRTTVILEKAGGLFLQVPPGAPEVRLVPLGANRYHCDGFPDDFVDSFAVTGATIWITVETGD